MIDLKFPSVQRMNTPIKTRRSRSYCSHNFRITKELSHGLFNVADNSLKDSLSGRRVKRSKSKEEVIAIKVETKTCFKLEANVLPFIPNSKKGIKLRQKRRALPQKQDQCVGPDSDFVSETTRRRFDIKLPKATFEIESDSDASDDDEMFARGETFGFDCPLTTARNRDNEDSSAEDSVLSMIKKTRDYHSSGTERQRRPRTSFQLKKVNLRPLENGKYRRGY
mmetsp:Transcript_12884/g.14158  ORF Transcript_12884/g.14158 Transcript_12884/m.14158 type:complete len:223 (-) Transcript_12884:358-1026(-)